MEFIKAHTFAIRFETPVTGLEKAAGKKAGSSLKDWKQQHINQVFMVRLY